jgi:hypothetical protein
VSEDDKTKADAPTEESTRSRRAASEKPAEDSGPPTYTTERLIAEAPDFLGCEPHVAAGALYDAPKEMTKADAKAAVKSWLKREITPPEEE